ncbi:E3 ubiquitin-protein ligase ATL6-like [Diospyros lotus]|uniref:E3 ubiquitin-protein ligase ATL6-like n=1 Tax=Diospyros lotus TaxID=55363 RepID=UPI002250B7C6|nr:E3 ubiquitin-protein ligase ATL6-like [Diospyros lotus]
MTNFSRRTIHVEVPMLLLLLLLAAAQAPFAAAQASPDSPSDYSYSNVDPSMAIVIVVLVSAFFFMGIFTIYIRQCSREAGATGIPGQAAAGNFPLSSRGLEPEVIESFPILHYSEVKEHKIGKGDLECAICINEFSDDETLRLLPKCDHVFHPECIDAWLASHTTCPVCRASLVLSAHELSGAAAQGTAANPIDSTAEHNFSSEIGEVQDQAQSRNQVSITVDEDRNRAPQVIETPKPNAQRVAKFPRSHSTGHSLVLPGDNCDRYTLRLPEEVRKQIVERSLQRTTSCVVAVGYRTGGDGSSRGRQIGRNDRIVRSDRWIFTKTPAFFSRNRSVLSAKVGVDVDLTAVESVKARGDGADLTASHLPV